MEKGFDSGSADRARIVLHAHNLTAPLTQAQVPTRQDNCVLNHREANDTLALGFVRLGSRCSVFLAIHVCQLEDSPIVKQLLLE